MASNCYTGEFFAELREGSERSAEVIVPLVLELVPARSVVDVGCGEGGWLSVFHAHGIEDVFGIDGEYVDRSALRIPVDRFSAVDLTRPLEIGRKFDLAVSLEVAEHLEASCADQFVHSLTQLAPIVLFSAAIPRQGGTHHVNEQWPDAWVELFRGQGFEVVDCIRNRVWENPAVEWWYAQNIFLFARLDALERNAALRSERERMGPGPLRLVHPRNYLDALRPMGAPDWRFRTASQLLFVCLRNALRRRFAAIVGRELPPEAVQNPPNYNVAVKISGCYATGRPVSRNEND